MNSLPLSTFATLLRHHRQVAGLTQEELAERANLSVQAIGALERGARRAPRKETVGLLAAALALTTPDRVMFEAAAHQQRLANVLATASRTCADAPMETTHIDDDALLIPSLDQRTMQFAVSDSASPGEATGFAQNLADAITSSSAFIWRFCHSRIAPLRGLGSKLIAGLLVVLLGGISLIAWSSDALASKRTICLATDMPTSGKFGNSWQLQHAIDLAAKQNQNLGNGYTLKVIDYDDTSPDTLDYDPQIGVHNVQQMVQNPCIVGMVGPYNSLVAAAEMPIAADAGLVMLSPTNTDPGLTLRPYAELRGWDFDQLHPMNKSLNYFRIAPNDVVQGHVAANFIFDQLGARNVYVVNEGDYYGEELAGAFMEGFHVRGGKFIGIESIPDDNRSVIADIASNIIATRPDAVYYAGLIDGGGGLLKAQLDNRGYVGSFVGGEGIGADPGFVAVAGIDAANGTYAVMPGSHPPHDFSEQAALYLRNYPASYADQRLVSGISQGYDAAMVLIVAIKHLIQVGQPVTRASLIDAVQHIHYTGVSGPISFDDNGDIAHGVFSLYRVQEGSWVYVQQLSA